MEKRIERILFNLGNSIASATDALTDFFLEVTANYEKKSYDASYHQNPAEIVSRSDHGFTVNGSKFLSIDSAFKNQVVYGGSGAGKTSNILIPNILHNIKECNFVINDPSCEIRNTVGAALHKATHEILIFDPSKPEISIQFNPIKYIKSKVDALKLAQLLILNTLGRSNDQFWNISASNILSLVFQYLAFYAEPQYATISNALYILENMSYGDKFDSLIANTNNTILISSYKSFLANDTRVNASVLATAKAALGLFEVESVKQVTAKNTLDIESFKSDKRVTLFINNNISNAKFYAPLTAVVLQQCFDTLMEKLPEKKATTRPLYVCIDESASVTFPSLPIIISNIRKYEIGCSLVYQSFHQIVSQYSLQEAKAIESNCFSRVFLPGTPIDIASNLEKEFGVTEVINEDGKKIVRPLMKANEIRECAEVLACVGAYRVLRLPLRPFFKTKLRRLAALPKYVPPVNTDIITPPIIPFE